MTMMTIMAMSKCESYSGLLIFSVVIFFGFLNYICSCVIVYPMKKNETNIVILWLRHCCCCYFGTLQFNIKNNVCLCQFFFFISFHFIMSRCHDEIGDTDRIVVVVIWNTKSCWLDKKKEIIFFWVLSVIQWWWWWWKLPGYEFFLVARCNHHLFVCLI